MTEQPPAGPPAFPPLPEQQYGQPYGQPQPFPTPNYGEPAGYGAPDHGAPAYGAPGQPTPDAVPAAPAGGPKKSKLPVLIAAAVAAVALVAAGLVLAGSRDWFAASGSSTSTEAVENVFQSLTDGDLLGVVDSLAPSEAKFSADMTGDFVDQLRRLEIIKASTTPDQLYAVGITASGLTYSPVPITINDHVQVVEVTGGTLTLKSGPTTDVLTPKVAAAIPDSPVTVPREETFDIATQTAETGHALRIAAVQQDGRWYPSVAYTVADNIAYTTIGPDYAAKLDPIAAVGAATPEAAMDNFLGALISGDVATLVSTLDPGTMGAVQDYASLGFNSGNDACLWNSGDDSATESVTCGQTAVSVSSSSWTTTAVTGGTKVSIGQLTFVTPDGEASITRDPTVPSLTVSVPGQDPMVISPNDVPDLFQALTDNFGVDLGDQSAQVTDIVKRELQQILDLGVIMVKGTDGQWYVSPMHTYSDVFVSLLRGLQPGDIDFFLDQMGK